MSYSNRYFFYYLNIAQIYRGNYSFFQMQVSISAVNDYRIAFK